MKRYITVRLLSSVAAIAHMTSSRGSSNVATRDELQAEAQATERIRWSWRTPAPNGADNGRSCGNEESSLHRRTLEHATEVQRRAGRRGKFVDSCTLSPQRRHPCNGFFIGLEDEIEVNVWDPSGCELSLRNPLHLLYH